MPNNDVCFIDRLGLMLCQFEKKDLMALVVLKHELIFSEKYDIGHLVTLTLPTVSSLVQKGHDRGCKKYSEPTKIIKFVLP